jgi:hypothetical protein
VFEKCPKNDDGGAYDSYQRRFWELQMEQFTLWMEHYIPDDIYKQWNHRRFVERDKAIVGARAVHVIL